MLQLNPSSLCQLWRLGAKGIRKLNDFIVWTALRLCVYYLKLIMINMDCQRRLDLIDWLHTAESPHNI